MSPVTSMRWTEEQELAYLHCLKEGTRQGMRTDTGFKASFIPFVNSQFAAKGLPVLRREQLNTKRAEWKAKLTAWQWLLMQQGIEYDEDRARILASEEQWEQFIRQNPTVKPFRFMTLKYKDDLYEIYGGRPLTGRYAYGSPWYEAQANNTLDGIHSYAIDQQSPQSLQNFASEPAARTESVTARAPALPLTPTSTEAHPEESKTVLERVLESTKMIAQQQRHQSRQAQDTTENPIAKAIKTLQSRYTDLGPDEFVRAVTVVEDHVHTFNALSGKWRDIWLRAKIME